MLIFYSFRFHITLRAPTAMVRHADEIPITYLNKGQTYTIFLVDTAPVKNKFMPTRYRTCIRIAFEDEEQRQRPASCWQIWKDSRGTNEADQRGGYLRGVEFLDPRQMDGKNEHKVNLETASLDGFAVTWSPVRSTTSDCSFDVRFNFLSTDFSNSKGVKGVAVRLCVKTELLTIFPGSTEDTTKAELCYCKVQLFRDHGAERKMSNDVARVKKTMNKMREDRARVESDLKDFAKPKRKTSVSQSLVRIGPGKMPRRKKVWSISSATTTFRTQIPAEEDLSLELVSLHDMLNSIRPVSSICLRGEIWDNPDVHRIQLPAHPFNAVKDDKDSGTILRGIQGSCADASIGVASIVLSEAQRPGGGDHALSRLIEATGDGQPYESLPEPIVKPGGSARRSFV